MSSENEYAELVLNKIKELNSSSKVLDDSDGNEFGFFVENNYLYMFVFDMKFDKYNLFISGYVDPINEVMRATTLTLQSYEPDRVGDDDFIGITYHYSSYKHDEVLKAGNESFEFNAMVENDYKKLVMYEFSFLLKAIIIKYFSHVATIDVDHVIYNTSEEEIEYE